MNTNVEQNPVNSNLDAFRKKMPLTNVNVQPDHLRYSLANPKLRNAAMDDAMHLINATGLPLSVVRPGSVPNIGNTFIVKVQNA